MTTHVSPAVYGGVFYHVKTVSDHAWSLCKRQGDVVFAEYAVYRKEGRGITWLECDADLCPSARHRSALDCKHVEIAQAHMATGEVESAVRWIKGGR